MKLKARRKTENIFLKEKSSETLYTQKSAKDMRSSYDVFYKTAFENKEGIKSLFSQQIEDERTRYRATLSPFLSSSARNFAYFSGKSILNIFLVFYKQKGTIVALV